MKEISVRLAKTSRDGWVMKWFDGERDRQRNCKGKTLRQATRERDELQDDLNIELSAATFDDFWRSFTDLHLSDCSHGHQVKSRTMKARLIEAAGRRKIAGIFRCNHVDARMLLDVEVAMKRSGIEPTTIKSNMATLWAMISWGQDNDYFAAIQRPRKRRNKRSKQDAQQSRKSKGRALAGEEIDRMIAAVPGAKKKHEDSAGFVRAIHVMRHTGMRLSEAWNFSWIPDDGRHYPVGLRTDNPCIRFDSIQKNGQSQLVPLTRSAAEYLRSIDSSGSEWVCRSSGARGEHKTSNRLGRVICAAGKDAGIVVKRFGSGKVKHASAHDLRRTFAVNLKRVLENDEIKLLTRHSNSEILVDHYLDDPDISTPDLMRKLMQA